MEPIIDQLASLTDIVTTQVTNIEKILGLTNFTTINNSEAQADMIQSLSALVCSVNTVIITTAFTLENKNAKVISSEQVEFVGNSLNHKLNVSDLDEEYENEQDNDSDDD